MAPSLSLAPRPGSFQMHPPANRILRIKEIPELLRQLEFRAI